MHTTCISNTEKPKSTVAWKYYSIIVVILLTLLDCVSKANAVVWASVSKMHFLGNNEANCAKILWKGSYPPFLQTLFSDFQNV